MRHRKSIIIEERKFLQSHLGLNPIHTSWLKKAEKSIEFRPSIINNSHCIALAHVAKTSAALLVSKMILIKKHHYKN